jgi:hypothetical protein
VCCDRCRDNPGRLRAQPGLLCVCACLCVCMCWNANRWLCVCVCWDVGLRLRGGLCVPGLVRAYVRLQVAALIYGHHWHTSPLGLLLCVLLLRVLLLRVLLLRVLPLCVLLLRVLLLCVQLLCVQLLLCVPLLCVGLLLCAFKSGLLTDVRLLAE